MITAEKHTQHVATETKLDKENFGIVVHRRWMTLKKDATTCDEVGWIHHAF